MAVSLSLLCLLAALSSIQAQLIQFSSGEGNFKLADHDTAPVIIVASNEQIGVARAAQDVAWDFGRVVGVSILNPASTLF
jgi:hypothetical protein